MAAITAPMKTSQLTRRRRTRRRSSTMSSSRYSSLSGSKWLGSGWVDFSGCSSRLGRRSWRRVPSGSNTSGAFAEPTNTGGTCADSGLSSTSMRMTVTLSGAPWSRLSFTSSSAASSASGVLAEDRCDLVLGDVAAEPVGAEEPAVTGLGGQHSRVEFGRGVHIAEHAHEHGAARMHRGLLGGDAAAVDEPLHEGVVLGDLLELAVAQAVDARVADVRERDVVADAEDAADGGAHAGELGVVEHGLGDQRVGGEHRGLQGELGVVGRGVELVGLGDALHRDRGRDVAARVAAHAVGDDEQVAAGVSAVLVVGADLADMRDGGAAVGRHALPPQLEARRADLDRGVQRDRRRERDALAVEVGAVGGVEVLDDPALGPEQQPGVVGRGVVVADDEAGLARSARS